MLKATRIVFALALVLAALIETFAQSPEPPADQAPKTARDTLNDKRGTKDQPLTINVVPTPEQQTAAERDAAEAKVKASREERLLEYTWYLVIVGAVQFLIFLLQLIAFSYQAYKLRQTVQSSERAIAVTRIIGEAQVRAYVSIKSAAIYFLGDTAMPAVEIVAANSGQSPALNFVWTPEVHYLPDQVAEHYVSEVDEEWAAQPGVDIHSAGENSGLFFVDDFAMVERIAVDGKIPERMGVSVTIQYTWTDVFGKSFVDLASFAGVAEIKSAADNQRAVHPLNTSQWVCRLTPIAKGETWAGVMVKAPENASGRSQTSAGGDIPSHA
jgi:hypothetical protein